MHGHIALLVASQVTLLTATLDALFGIMGTSCRVIDLLGIHCH